MVRQEGLPGRRWPVPYSAFHDPVGVSCTGVGIGAHAPFRLHPGTGIGHSKPQRDGAVRQSGLVFTRQNGEGWHPSHVSDWFARIARIARAAGLPPITLHGLRHGAASMALAVGTDVKVVSAELGHSTTHFTQDTY